MTDPSRTNQELLEENNLSHQGINELEQSESGSKQMEEAVRESEERFHRLADSTWEGIIIHKEGIIVDVNKSALKMFGYPAEEVTGRKIIDFLAPESIEPALQKFREGATRDQLYLEVNGLRKDNTAFSVEVLGRPIRYKNLDARVLSIRDITDRKRMEEALRERIKELNCLYSISSLLESPGISLDEVLRRTVTLIPPAFQFPEIAEASIVLAGKTFQTASFRETSWMLARKVILNGNPVGQVEVCYLEERQASDKGPFLEEEGKLISVIAERLSRITKLMQIQQDLMEKLAQLKETHRLAHIGIWDWTAETDTLIWSEELYHIVGCDPQLPAPSFAEHSRIFTPDSWNHFKAANERSRETGESYQIELELVCPDGSTRRVNAFGRVKYDRAGRIIGLNGMVQDITERKVLEIELAEYRKGLEEVVKVRTAELDEVNKALKVTVHQREADKKELQEKILSNVNDLIIPYLEKIKISPLNAAQEAYLDIIETNLKAIIDPFLSHMTTKHYHLTPKEIQVADLIKAGRSSPEIASILKVSTDAIAFHRASLRKKLGLAREDNLQSFLQHML